MSVRSLGPECKINNATHIRAFDVCIFLCALCVHHTALLHSCTVTIHKTHVAKVNFLITIQKIIYLITVIVNLSLYLPASKDGDAMGDSSRFTIRLPSLGLAALGWVTSHDTWDNTLKKKKITQKYSTSKYIKKVH